MKVSRDQNTVTLRAVFVEGYGCGVCYLDGICETPSKTRPCVPEWRIDGKSGHFEEATGDE